MLVTTPNIQGGFVISYTHLTLSERSKIETYVELGYSIRTIAKRIHRTPSTFSRKLRRHQNCTIEEEQTHYQANKLNCGAELKKTVQEKRYMHESQ